MSLSTVVQQTLTRHPEGLALEFRDSTYEWSEVRSFRGRLDAALSRAGIGRGGRVGVLARCSPAVVSSFYGLMASGRTIVIVNPFRSPEAIAEEVGSLALGGIVLHRSDWEQAVVASALGDNLVAALIVEEETLAGPETVAPALPPSEISPDLRHGGIEMLTSGTTGAPKRIRMSADTILGAARDYILTLEEFEDFTGSAGRLAPLLNFWPLTTIGGLSFVFHAAVEGRPMVLYSKFSAAEWTASVEKYRPTVLTVPPAQLRMLVNARIPKEKLTSAKLMRSANAPLDPSLKEEFEQEYGIPTMSYYGATEFCGVVTGWPIADYERLRVEKPGSVGRPRPGVKIRVVDPETGEPLPPREVGLIEIVVGWIGPDWMRTSDSGFVDGDGYVYLQGRKDGAINRGGFKIVPEIVVSVLRSHPAVSDAAVIGAPDARLGEVPVAFVELKPGAVPLSEETLRRHARKQLASYQVPVRFITMPELPRTPMMKINTAALRRLAEKEVSGEVG